MSGRSKFRWCFCLLSAPCDMSTFTCKVQEAVQEKARERETGQMIFVLCVNGDKRVIHRMYEGPATSRLELFVTCTFVVFTFPSHSLALSPEKTICPSHIMTLNGICLCKGPTRVTLTFVFPCVCTIPSVCVCVFVLRVHLPLLLGSLFGAKVIVVNFVHIEHTWTHGQT